MKKEIMDLQFFSEGGGATDGEGGEQGSTPEVIYGKRDDEEGGEEGIANQHSGANEEQRISFDELIKGDYKEDYEKSLKNHVGQRLKGHEADINKYRQGLKPLFDKYGTTDEEAIFKALSEDNSIYEDLAMEEGITPEHAKQLRVLQAENEALKQAEEQRVVDQQYNQWVAEAEELKGTYPNFDIGNESTDPKFMQMLEIGMGVKEAFEALHHNDILNGVIKTTAEETYKNTTDNIMARGRRPAENGLKSSAAKVFKSDPSKFTDEDMANIKKRVRDGETIVL